ncbi:MAG: YchJ family metal-binding protein, partial [Marinobacterium sp.]
QVEFNAHFKAADGRTGVLHERSNFRRDADKWIYVDGDVEVN